MFQALKIKEEENYFLSLRAGNLAEEFTKKGQICTQLRLPAVFICTVYFDAHLL